MKDSTKSLIYNFLTVLICSAFFVVYIINVLNYADIKKDKNDKNLGLSKTFVDVMFWINIVVVSILGYLVLYNLFKLILRPELSVKKALKMLYKDKAKSDFDMSISIGKNPIEAIQVAASAATHEARKLGKSLNESIKIGTIAGTQAGILSGIDKGDSKVISKFASENVVRNELMKYRSS